MAVSPPSPSVGGKPQEVLRIPERALVAITNNAGNTNSYQSITMADALCLSSS